MHARTNLCHGIIAVVPLPSMDKDTECITVKSDIDDHAGSFHKVLEVRD